MYTQIEKCRRQIAQALNAPDASIWNTEDFEKLSDSIFTKTGVRLSVSTLKRIWGKVNYSSSPSMATLNTLARFLDYENWRNFEQKNPDNAVSGTSSGSLPSEDTLTEASLTPANPGNSSERRKKILLPALFGAALILIAGFVLSGFFRSSPSASSTSGSASPGSTPAGSTPAGSTPGSISAGMPASGMPIPPGPASGAPAKFEARKTSDDLPNSVVFDYDASGFGTDSVYIQQSWDASRREKVLAAGKQHTSLYYYPGYFDAKLVVNGQVQKHSPVFIETKGWKGIVATQPVPVYLTATEITAPGSLGITAATLRQKTGSPVFTNTWVDFLNIRAFEGLDAARFTMDAVLRNTSTVEQSLCRKIRVTIVGKESAIIIPLADKGCIADIQLLTGDRMISGKDQDLSAFGCDFRTFQRVSCKVENGHLQIFLNGALILNTPQERTIGDIVGLNVAFEGTGEIKSISLGAPGPGKPMYQEKF